MARPRHIDPLLVTQAQQTAKTTKDADLLRQCQAVLLPAILGATLEQAAAALGVGRCSVPRLQKAFRARCMAADTPAKPRNWGGCRQSLMSPQEEREFLQPWLEQAQSGSLVVVSPIRAALAQKLGRPVKASVVYRLLARHGWRKVAPDTRHPKGDPALQEDWKKNSRKHWNPCSSGKS